MTSALVVAGGAGERFGAEIPKQFVALHGKPILAHAIGAVAPLPNLRRLVIVVPEGWVGHTRDSVVPAARCEVDVRVVVGGPRRRDSVCRGLLELDEPDLVVVHDGARPLATLRLAQRVVEAAQNSGAAVPALPLSETVKQARDGQVLRTVNREELWRVQTPQAFDLGLLPSANQAGR